MILANGCNITKSEKCKGVWILSVPTVYVCIYLYIYMYMCIYVCICISGVKISALTRAINFLSLTR